jgi:hypothetical protein
MTDKLTEENFDTLEVGAIVKERGLFAGLSSEPVSLRIAKRTPEEITFVATYFGVTLGAWTCERMFGGGLKWRF